MRKRSALGLYVVLAAAFALTAAPASAQFSPRFVSDPTTPEEFIVEGFAGLWSPAADMAITSESLGIAGTAIDFRNDLGLTDQRFGELRVALKPGRKHKLRYQYIPMAYAQSAVAHRDIVFNGQRYRVGVQVDSLLRWRAHRFGYEYDFVKVDRGFGGFIIEAKYTDVLAELAVPGLLNEFAHARAPIPALGGIARFYVIPAASVTVEVTGLKIPDSIDESFEAHYADIDIYGVFNVTDRLGAQFGWRSLDVGYVVSDDTGSFLVRGVYFGGVARF
jgi:hypothetical protein